MAGEWVAGEGVLVLVDGGFVERDTGVCGAFVCGAGFWDAEPPMLGGIPQIMQ